MLMQSCKYLFNINKCCCNSEFQVYTIFRQSVWRPCKRGTPSYSNLCLYYEEGRGLPESWKQKKKNGKKIRKRRQTCVDENDLIKKRKDDVQLCAAYLCHQPEKKNWLDILWRTSWLVPLGVYGNTMIASVSFVLTGNLIYHFPQKGHISTFSLLNMHEQKSNSQRNLKQSDNHISSSIMVLQTNTMN